MFKGVNRKFVNYLDLMIFGHKLSTLWADIFSLNITQENQSEYSLSTNNYQLNLSLRFARVVPVYDIFRTISQALY